MVIAVVQPTFGSIFAGIGGFDVGFERVGIRCVWQVENDDYCREILEAHWPHVARFGDVRDWTPSRDEHSCDVICGGFPCQDLSVAGKRAGLAGSRSGLFWHIVRVASILRPEWLVLENVPGLLSSNGGRDMGAIIGGLEDAGYSCAWRVLDSQWFGVAQRRRRVFIVGHSDAERAGAVLFEPEGGAGHPAAVRKAGADVAFGFDARSHGIGQGHNTTYISAPLTSNPYGDHESRESLLVFNWQAGGSRDFTGCGSKPGALHAGQTPAVAYNIIGSGQEGRNHAYRTERTGALQHKGNRASGNEAGTVIAVPSDEPLQQQRPDDGGRDVSHALNSHGGSHGRIDGESETFFGAPTYPDRVRDFAGLPRRLDGRRYKALGNAVTVQVAEWIGRRILEARQRSQP
jgi:DNA (cytosine-5)-methyltransferase 1